MATHQERVAAAREALLELLKLARATNADFDLKHVRDHEGKPLPKVPWNVLNELIDRAQRYWNL